MKFIKSFLLATGVFLIVAAAILAGTGLYLYSHPEKIKPWIEKAVSAATGASWTMESVSWSLQPLTLQAQGVVCKTPDPRQSLSIKIPSISANMIFSGSWGRRTLVVKKLKTENIAVDLAFPIAAADERKTPADHSGWAKHLIDFFFFTDMRLASGEVLNGHIAASWDDQRIALDHFHAETGPGKPLALSSDIRYEDASRGMYITAPAVSLAGLDKAGVKSLEFIGELRAENIKVRDPALGIRTMDAAGIFDYSHAAQRLHLKSLQIRCGEVALAPGAENEHAVSTAQSLSAETTCTWDIERNQITLSPMDCNLRGWVLPGQAASLLPPLDADLEAETIVSGDAAIEITDAVLKVHDTGLRIAGREIDTGEIKMILPKGRIGAKAGRLGLPALHFEGFGLKNVLLALDLKGDRLSMALDGEETGMLQSAIAYSIIPNDWDVSAVDALHIDAAGPVSGPWQVIATCSLGNLAFANKDGSVMGEGIALAAEVQGAVNLRNASLRFDADLNADAGEALYDKFYLNLAQFPAAASGKGVYRLGQQLQFSESRLQLTDIASVDIQGALIFGDNSIRDAELTVAFPDADLVPIFRHFVQEPFGTGQPLLADVETSGTVSAEFAVKKSENNWRLKGSFGWHNGNLVFGDKGASLKGVELDLPVWYQSPAVAGTGEGVSGNLIVQSVALPLLSAQPLRLHLDAGPNRISVNSPTLIETSGGPFRVGPIEVRDLFGPEVSLDTRLQLHEIRLGPILSHFGVPISEGTLTGMLDPVRYQDQKLIAEGELKARVFDGTILINDLGASGLFTSAPVYNLDARWNDLLLSEITTDTAFGKIEGVLKGYLRDFQFAYGQPQEFDLLLETVEKEGVAQTVSVKAVENIAQIAGGQSPFMGLAGAFVSFFDTFPYTKIGIRASLENDMFTINGIIREDGKEYLVKRGTFSGVNVVNRNPDNKIRFKDMVKRIHRITGQGEPVIK